MPWEIDEKKTLLESYPFNVERLELLDKKEGRRLSHPFFRLQSPDFVNILAITPEQEVVLVEQPRAGAMELTWEIPGGMVDAGEALEIAARRELEEETGYSYERLESLGSINPNPAIMTNKLHMFLATGCRPVSNRRHFPDENESLRVFTKSITELQELIKDSKLNNALVALSVFLGLSKYETMSVKQD